MSDKLTKAEVGLIVAGIIAIVLISMSLSGAIIYGAWNYVAVPVFSAPAIPFWHALLIGFVIGLFRGGAAASK
jgi:hypothetical protein